jgi:hypothetical protein
MTNLCDYAWRILHIPIHILLLMTPILTYQQYKLVSLSFMMQFIKQQTGILVSLVLRVMPSFRIASSTCFNLALQWVGIIFFCCVLSRDSISFISYAIIQKISDLIKFHNFNLELLAFMQILVY